MLGNLKEVDPPQSNDKIEYVVDGQNRRIAKKVDGTITRKWLYSDQLNPIAELDLNDNITKRFIYATASNIPDVVVDVSGANPVVYRIISDHLGSPRFVIDISNGITALDLEYDEWGVETLISGNRDLIPFGFAGGHYDPDTKLVRFGARDYDPEVGRWTSKDPIEFEGGDTNLFGYVLNDPINSIDPTGNCPWCGKYIVDYSIEVVIQLVQNGGRVECINWGEARDNAIENFFFPPGIGKLAQAYKKYGKFSKAGNKAPQPGDKVYRVWGDGANSNGRSWTRTDPRTTKNYRDDAGLPNDNSGRFVTEGTLKNTRGVNQRDAFPAHGNRGGLDELVIPDPAKQVRIDRVSGANPEF